MKKKIIYTLAALLIASATTFTACSSSDDITTDEPQQPATPKTCTLTVNATKGDATTRALSLDQSGAKDVLNATWTQGDKVTVYYMYEKDMGGGYTTSMPTEIGTLTAQSSGASTTLTGEITTMGIEVIDFTNPTAETHDLAAGDKLSLSYSGTLGNGGLANSGEQDGTLQTLADYFDRASADLTVKSVSGSTVSTTESAADFVNQTFIIRFTLLDKATNSAISPSSLQLKCETTGEYPVVGTKTITIPASTYETNGAGVLFAVLPPSSQTTGFSGNLTLTATVGDNTYTYSKSGVMFENGQYYEITVKMTKQPPVGALAGQFSVNADGDKVYFSKGNLQATYNGTAWTWALAEHQWDYIGGRSEEGSETQTGNNFVTTSSPFISTNATVDLFGWVGASSTWEGVNMYGITSAYGSVIGKNDGYGSAKEALKADWGTLAISNGGNTANSGWRTLTKDEWIYLFETRTVNGGTGIDKNYTIGQSVNGVAGAVIYPDNYTGPAYSGSNWADFEAAGCVFLPAAGYRTDIYVYDAGTLCNYWSSTARSNSQAYAFKYISSTGFLDTWQYAYRDSGKSVRLVRPVE